MPIHFYHEFEPFGEFSNFYLDHPIELDGLSWPTSEHYYQAMKFPNHPEIREEIRQTSECLQTKVLANEIYTHLVDQDWWDNSKDAVMLKAVRAKFTQHQDLQDFLLDSGDQILIEHTENDLYWGDGLDGSGKSMLGKVLMQVREEIKKTQ
ncbi:MAG: NADAR family protein [Anaerolineaceae bacterium]|nr:NADAR family protein [Anaerolineaceae bacterium]